MQVDTLVLNQSKDGFMEITVNLLNYSDLMFLSGMASLLIHTTILKSLVGTIYIDVYFILYKDIPKYGTTYNGGLEIQ